MNKHTTLLRRVLCLALAAVMAVGLCACPAGTPDVTTGSSGTSGSTTVAKPGSSHPDDVTDPTYQNGGQINGAGVTLKSDAFATTEHTPDTANAIEKTASQFRNLFRSGSIEEGKTYKITDNTPVTFSSAYDFKSIILIAPAGVIFEDCHDVEIRDLTVIGPVTIRRGNDVKATRLDVQNEGGTALTVDAESNTVTLTDCRFKGATAIANAAADFTVTYSTVNFTATGLSDTATGGTTVRYTVFSGAGTALATTATGAYIRENSFDLTAASVAVSVSGSPVNGLIALNVMKGAQKSITVTGATNFSIILNSAITVEMIGNTSVYVCDNALGGRLRAKNNNYFLADGNAIPKDNLDHSTLQAGNTNTNGDSLMYVDARLETGADENLLPHTNKELFVGMERSATVWEGNYNTGLTADRYLEELALTEDYIILAPGVYVSGETNFNAAHSDTVVYAYGAQMERPYTSAVGSLSRMFDYNNGAANITIKGLTIGFERQSCGQVYVLSKRQNAGYNILTVVTGAGMDNEFGVTNTLLYNTYSVGAQRENTFYAYCDTGFNSIKKLDNGLMEIQVGASVYNMIEKGDILTCRSMQSGTTVTINNSTGITFKDMTLYGNSGGFAFVEGNNRTATTYYRLHNTTKNGEIISKETYDWYKSLEEQYGVNLEVSIDDLGRYRGSLPHIGSIDATHTTGCAQGSVAVSCIFENMCDDATNQNHTHARIADLIDNGDGTTTVVYKGVYSKYSYDNYATGAGGYCKPFVVGDRVYIYTASGQLVCDTEALSATANYMVMGANGQMVQKTEFCEQKYERHLSKYPGANKNDFYTKFYFVTVDTEAVNFAAVKDLDLSLNTWQDEQKVLIDNMSMASNGFVFDNCLSQNIRSRGLLIKASEGKIVNCTFRNIGMACAAILYEIYWGESGVSENLLVDRNLIDHTGYFTKYTSGNEDRYSPIAIEGLGSRVDEDYLLYKNITISNNIIRNRTTKYAVYVNSAKDIKILNNDFGYYTEGESEDNYSAAIHLNGAMNVEISGNTYAPTDLPIVDYITVEHIKNIYGTDVTYNDAPIFEDEE